MSQLHTGVFIAKHKVITISCIQSSFFWCGCTAYKFRYTRVRIVFWVICRPTGYPGYLVSRYPEMSAVHPNFEYPYYLTKLQDVSLHPDQVWIAQSNFLPSIPRPRTNLFERDIRGIQQSTTCNFRQQIKKNASRRSTKCAVTLILVLYPGRMCSFHLMAHGGIPLCRVADRLIPRFRV